MRFICRELYKISELTFKVFFLHNFSVENMNNLGKLQDYYSTTYEQIILYCYIMRLKYTPVWVIFFTYASEKIFIFLWTICFTSFNMIQIKSGISRESSGNLCLCMQRDRWPLGIHPLLVMGVEILTMEKQPWSSLLCGMHYFIWLFILSA